MPGGTLYLIFIQVASRALTFIGNQFVLRYLSPPLLGLAVQLELYSVSVLYFSRESLRVALQRQSTSQDQPETNSKNVKKESKHDSLSLSGQTQAAINLSYLALLLGIPLTIILGWLYHHGQRNNVQMQDSAHFTLSLSIYTAATLIELLVEPCFVVIQQRLLYQSRARNETLAAIFKCIATCLATLIASRRGLKASVLPFALGQIVYSTVLGIGYLSNVVPLAQIEGFSLLPRFFPSPSSPTKSSSETESETVLSLFPRSILSLTSALYLQSIFKQFLTQGDSLILSFFAPLSEQGSFALASNYGGLLARLLFQPIEESTRNYLGGVLSQKPKSKTKAASSATEQDALGQASEYLVSLLRLYAILSTLTLSLLPTLLPRLIQLLLGPAWFNPQISALLSLYVFYIPFLAVNGLLDAFVTSLASPTELKKQSLAMAGFTGVYLGGAWVLLVVMGWGGRGLVVANMLNMGLRIAWGVVFVGERVRVGKGGWKRVVGEMVPDMGLWVVGGLGAAVMKGVSDRGGREWVVLGQLIGVSGVTGLTM